jgi:hypothetical protein
MIDYTDKVRFPDKLLVNGRTSMMKRLPGGEWARVQRFPNSNRAIWTWNSDQHGKKRGIMGTIDGHAFVPDSFYDAVSIYEHYRRGKGPAKGIMEAA